MQQILNRKNKIVIFGVLLSGFFWANMAKAVCPVCIVAVGAGLGFSRWFGVDDVVSSVWIGGLLASMSIWTIIWLNKKNWGFKYENIIIPAAYYLLTLVPLYFADIAGHPLNKIFGIDKILFGSIAGTILFLLAVQLHKFLKIKNGGKSFFSFQKVVLPVVVLALTSLLFYILLIWKII